MLLNNQLYHVQFYFAFYNSRERRVKWNSAVICWCSQPMASCLFLMEAFIYVSIFHVPLVYNNTNSISSLFSGICLVPS